MKVWSPVGPNPFTLRKIWAQSSMALKKEELPDKVEAVEDVEDLTTTKTGRWKNILLKWGVEERGIVPVPLEERTDTQYSKIFFLFLSSNYTILSLSFGTLGPSVYQLSLRDSCLVILAFDVFCAAFPAFFAIWGAHLGMRQMTLSRYIFGFYGATIPCFLNLLGLFGFTMLCCIIGGQTLASVTDGHLSWTVGIVIFTVSSIIVSFFGYKFLHWFERYAWIPVFIATVIAVGINWKHLGNHPPQVPASVASILGFGGIQGGLLIAWSGYSADYGVYLSPQGSRWTLFWCGYFGILLPLVVLQAMGAAFAAAATSVPAWSSGFAGGNIGGLVEATFQPLGAFGKILTVIMSLSVAPNLVSNFYSASLNYQVVIPRLVGVPRYVFIILTGAISLPIAIIGAHRLNAAITNFLGLIGYWTSIYAVELTLEHLCFRKSDFANYDKEAWNDPKRLPWGLGALGAGVLSFALIIPSMGQAWFTGPIAAKSGNLGLEVALGVTTVLYPPLRWLEIKIMGSL